MEELQLTDPVVVPATTTNKYHVISFTMDMEAQTVPGTGTGTEPGLVMVNLRDNNNMRTSYRYTGKQATDMIKFLNTANCSTKSMHKRILEQLSKDGLLTGTVVGTPDPAPPPVE
jgi:hypothetical protein